MVSFVNLCLFNHEFFIKTDLKLLYEDRIFDP